MSDERLDRIEHLVARIRDMTLAVQALEAATVAKRAELVRLEAELANLAVRRAAPRLPSQGRAKSGERQNQILALAQAGLTRKEIRQQTGLPSHVVNAALRRLREAGRLPDERQMELAPHRKQHLS